MLLTNAMIEEENIKLGEEFYLVFPKTIQSIIFKYCSKFHGQIDKFQITTWSIFWISKCLIKFDVKNYITKFFPLVLIPLK